MDLSFESSHWQFHLLSIGPVMAQLKILFCLCFRLNRNRLIYKKYGEYFFKFKLNNSLRLHALGWGEGS